MATTETISAGPAMEPATRVAAGSWRIDPVHSTVGFEIRHLGISTFAGRFTGFEGALVFSESGLEAVRGSIDMASVDVVEPQLSAHLGSEDFFDTANHPAGRFEATAVERLEDGRYTVRGDLELRGVARPVELSVTVEGSGVDMAGNEKLSLAAEGSLDRTEYGITWNSRLENGALLLAERVRLVLRIQAMREEA